MLLGFGGTFCGYEKQTVVGITVFLDSHFRKYLQCRILQVSLPKYLESPYLSSFPLPLPLSKKDTLFSEDGLQPPPTHPSASFPAEG